MIAHLENATHILAAVVQMASRGDNQARASLYNQFSRQMFSICVRMTGNYDDAKDLLHDSFLTAFSRLHQLNDSNAFGGWLRKIVVNTCIAYTKKNFEWETLDDASTINSHDENIEWLKEIGFEQIQKEIKNLPQGCREVFNLYVLEDFTHQDIADNLGISVSTSKTQYHRARQLLKERLLKQLVSHGSI